MTTVRSQEIWREACKHEAAANEVWWRGYKETECFTRKPVMQAPAPAAKLDSHYLIPGYSGHVPRQQFAYAQTFGRMSREVGAQDGKSPNPERTRKMDSYNIPPTQVLPRIATPEPKMDYHPPGYGGFVPGKQFAFGTTYGTVTRASNKPLQAQYQDSRDRRMQKQEQYIMNRRAMRASMRQK